MTSDIIQDIEDYVLTLLKDGYKLHTPDYADKVAEKFGLKIISIDGTTRTIFKEKNSRTVIKVGYPSHNRAEYATYKALECSVVGELLAPCLMVSPKGYALRMAYIPKPIPNAKGEYYWFNPEFNAIRVHLESQYSFIKNYNKYSWGADFHEENMRMDHQGNIKIIDYSNLLADMFSRRTTTTIKSAIKGVMKLDFPRVNIKMYSRDRKIYYENNGKVLEANIDPTV